MTRLALGYAVAGLGGCLPPAPRTVVCVCPAAPATAAVASVPQQPVAAAAPPIVEETPPVMDPTSPPRATTDRDPMRAVANTPLPGQGAATAAGTASSTGLPQKLSTADFKAGLAPALQEVGACASRHRRDLEDRPSRMTLKITIEGATGTVRTASATRPYAGTGLASCIARAVSLCRFPRFGRQTQGVQYTLDLPTLQDLTPGGKKPKKRIDLGAGN